MRKIIERALISVSDKTGILELAQALHTRGVQILSTGGTAKLLANHDIPVTEVSDYTDFPEIMEGRVKTLHPRIHGGLLGRRGIDDSVMAKHNIPCIDLVVVNLYPFEATIARKDCDLTMAIENIDIGGPAMLRSSAKNHTSVTVITDANDYNKVLAEIEANNGNVSDKTRFELALKVFEHTARYDSMIANYLGSIQNPGEAASKFKQFSNTINLQFNKVQDMRYGENHHQNAAFYIEHNTSEPSIATAKQLQGKKLSYNNVVDTDAALECIKQFTDPACVIVKHSNPCGVAISSNIKLAYDLAYATDTESAFGGIIAFNHELDATTASAIIERQFIEVIITPSVSAEAVGIITAKKNLRLLTCGQWNADSLKAMDYKRVTGGLLVQNKDQEKISPDNLKVMSKRQPTEQEIQDLLFAWKVGKFVKSNAIIYAKNGQTIGVGAGQMSRVNSARIAAIKAEHAGLEVKGSVMASDAFFPFRDGIDNAAKAGIVAVIQPGGSIRDEEIIAAADEHNMSMLFTGMRHFRH